MQQQNSDMNGKSKARKTAAIAGILVFLLLLVLVGWGFFGSLIAGVIVFVILMMVLQKNSGASAGDTASPSASAPAPQSAAPVAPSASAVADEPAAPVETNDPSPQAAADPAPEAAADPAPETAPASVIKPSTALPGQDDLASRKGEWKYEGGNTQTTKAPEAAAPAVSAAEPTPDYDGDGVLEGENEGVKPQTLAAAREGGADNLKEIKGVGPKLETLLNSMGFFHFDQIANWSADEIAWVNANLAGFKGRVSRDNWVEQAKILAAGGDTEFSKRVDKGDVY